MLLLPAFTKSRPRIERSHTIIHADVVKWLRRNQWLVEAGYMRRYHAVFADPPYGIAFMNSRWDDHATPQQFQAWVTEWARLMLSFVYPGAVLAMFGGSRTYHRLAAGLEDAGWEIFDSALYWGYGSGFPKAHDISKALDREAGAEREVVNVGQSGKTAGFQLLGNSGIVGGEFPITAPATPLAARWDGYKTALKPAYEPLVLARAPREDYTFAELARTFGTGALNIDGGRIEAKDAVHAPQPDPTKRVGVVGSDLGISNSSVERMHAAQRESIERLNDLGRYPANLILGCACEGRQHQPDCPVAVLDAQSGVSKSSSGVIKRAGGFARQLENRTDRPSTIPDGQGYDDFGGASRFFYTAKAATWEREIGLSDFAQQTVNDGRDTPIDNAYQRGETNRRNPHPTVKPIKLTEYIARLILPPPLDEPRRLLVPFAGVGSEMIGAALAGWDDVTGIEMTAEYIPVNEARRKWWVQFASYDEARKAAGVPDEPEAEEPTDAPKETGPVQLEMFAA